MSIIDLMFYKPADIEVGVGEVLKVKRRGKPVLTEVILNYWMKVKIIRFHCL